MLDGLLPSFREWGALGSRKVQLPDPGNPRGVGGAELMVRRHAWGPRGPPRCTAGRARARRRRRGGAPSGPQQTIAWRWGGGHIPPFPRSVTVCALATPVDWAFSQFLMENQWKNKIAIKLGAFTPVAFSLQRPTPPHSQGRGVWSDEGGKGGDYSEGEVTPCGAIVWPAVGGRGARPGSGGPGRGGAPSRRWL